MTHEDQPGWPYDLRPMADQGRDEYWNRADGQGALVSAPEREGPVTDYERLLEALYVAALNAKRKTTKGNFITLSDFFEQLEALNPSAAHQVDAGVRDAQKQRDREEYQAHKDDWSGETTTKETLHKGMRDLSTFIDRLFVKECVKEAIDQPDKASCPVCGASEGTKHLEDCPLPFLLRGAR